MFGAHKGGLLYCYIVKLRYVLEFNLPYRNFKIPRHSESRLRAMTPKILVLWRDEESPGARDGQGIAR
ncbi:hypothetical protein A2Y83_00560 [Candidatus Falkowbacteria bacterium RBG_13_39_14]|uniref:Uncharacterized protein n=1 Tax=Candidatus Falkowbacteria bacterium RBG_13_39_14 TaxID=1797985 RepID=A0A1F5S8K8_9BACT|nr:MAG: hypothetical protein A2Y83_00560 [Candidatus Falkowbacteria bacterium RBG_13_39_14]